MLQLMREGCSYTYPPLSIVRYSFIQLSELKQCRVIKLAQGFNTAARIRTRSLAVESPKLIEPLRSTSGTLYGTTEQQTVDNARLQLFGEGKLGLEMLPPTRDVLELHTARANYQAKFWLQADQEHIDIPSPTDISAWMMESDCLKAVWTRLPPNSRCVSRAGHLWMQG